MPRGKVLNPPPGVEEFLTIEEVARVCGRSIAGLYTGRNRGLPPGSLGVRWGNRLWFRRSDIQRWLAERLDDAFAQRWEERNQRRPEPIITHARELFDAKKAAGDG